MTRQDIVDKDFKEYALDHLEHFDAIPVEFETHDGEVLHMTECWDMATRLGLTQLIKE